MLRVNHNVLYYFLPSFPFVYPLYVDIILLLQPQRLLPLQPVVVVKDVFPMKRMKMKIMMTYSLLLFLVLLLVPKQKHQHHHYPTTMFLVLLLVWFLLIKYLRLQNFSFVHVKYYQYLLLRQQRYYCCCYHCHRGG